MNQGRVFYGATLMLISLVIFFLYYTNRNINFSKNNFNHNEQNATKSLNIEGIKTLNIEGVVDVTYEYSDSEIVYFEFNPKYTNNISEYENQTLNIDFESIKKFKIFETNNNNIKVLVKSKSIENINSDGVGDFVCKDELKNKILNIHCTGTGKNLLKVNSENIDIVNDGVGDLIIEGESTNAKLTNTGVGKFDASKLKTQNANATNDGVGNMNLNAESTLELNNTGVGSLKYSGAAIIKTLNSEGVGKITKE